jgi:DNA-binding NarL/FixJ family response regulator
MESRRPRALIADDHPPMLHAVGRLLSREVDVIAMVTDGQEAVSEALEHEPDLLVLDIAMPRLSGIAAAAQLKALGSHARIVFVTNLHDVEFVREALALGAVGFVVKDRIVADLLPAVRRVLAGERFVSPTIDR